MVAGDSFVLHGTVPVPKGTFLGVPGSPYTLALCDPDGEEIETQMEIVSRYSDAALDGADVVELIARVDKFADWPVGQRRAYSVKMKSTGSGYNWPSSPSVADLLETDDLSTSMLTLLSDSASVVIVAEDQFGNRYTGYPLQSADLKLHRYGDIQTTLRSYVTLEPENPSATTFPHLFGCHVYFTTTKGVDVLGMDVRFNNGQEDFDDSQTPANVLDTPLGDVYFKDINTYLANDLGTFFVPQQQTRDSFSYSYPALPASASLGGRSYFKFPVVEAIGDGSMHVIESTSQFHRRLAVTTLVDTDRGREYLDQFGLGFAIEGFDDFTTEEFWSWFNKDTGRYFPQNAVLPTLNYTNSNGYGGLVDLRSSLTSWYEALRDAIDPTLTSGFSSPDNAGAKGLGWANPLGSQYQGATGGAFVRFLGGTRVVGASSRDGWRHMQLSHRLTTDRQDNVIWDIQGNPTQIDNWLTAPNPILYPHNPNDQARRAKHTLGSNLNATDFKIGGAGPYAPNQGVIKPAWDMELLDYDGHDGQHLTRYIAEPMGLIWIGNDPLAKDDMEAIGEMGRFAHARYNSGSNPRSTSASNLYEAVLFALDHPSSAIPAGRAEGWVLQAMSAAFATGTDAMRATSKPWFQSWSDVIAAGLMTGLDDNGVLIGTVGASQNNPKYYGQPDTDTTVPRAEQKYESYIFSVGCRAAVESVMGPDQPGGIAWNDNLELVYRSYVAPVNWSPSQGFPWDITAVTPYYDDPLSGAPAMMPFGTLSPYYSNMSVTPTLPNHGLGNNFHYLLAVLGEAWQLTYQAEFKIKAQEAIEAKTGQSFGSVKHAIQSYFDPSSAGIFYSQWGNAASLLGEVQ